MAAQKAKRKGKSLFENEPKPKGDLTALAEQFKENPALYVGAAVFILICFLAGILYRSYSAGLHRELCTEYAKALENEDAEARYAALEPLLSRKGDPETMSEIVYMAGETAFRAKEYDKAKTAFERVQAEYPDSPYVPDAVEGLGFIAEDQNDYDTAYSTYEGIAQKWPTSFTARRQPLNLARVEEQRGNLERAIQSYREQTTLFPESHVARQAQQALDRLGKSHPELFASVPVEDTTKMDLPALSNLELKAETAPPAVEPAGPSTATEPVEAVEEPAGAPAEETAGSSEPAESAAP